MKIAYQRAESIHLTHMIITYIISFVFLILTVQDMSVVCTSIYLIYILYDFIIKMGSGWFSVQFSFKGLLPDRSDLQQQLLWSVHAELLHLAACKKMGSELVGRG